MEIHTSTTPYAVRGNIESRESFGKGATSYYVKAWHKAAYEQVYCVFFNDSCHGGLLNFKRYCEKFNLNPPSEVFTFSRLTTEHDPLYKKRDGFLKHVDNDRLAFINWVTKTSSLSSAYLAADVGKQRDSGFSVRTDIPGNLVLLAITMIRMIGEEGFEYIPTFWKLLCKKGLSPTDALYGAMLVKVREGLLSLTHTIWAVHMPFLPRNTTPQVLEEVFSGKELPTRNAKPIYTEIFDCHGVHEITNEYTEFDLSSVIDEWNTEHSTLVKTDFGPCRERGTRDVNEIVSDVADIVKKARSENESVTD